jgi:hypothetical protein
MIGALLLIIGLLCIVPAVALAFCLVVLAVERWLVWRAMDADSD